MPRLLLLSCCCLLSADLSPHGAWGSERPPNMILIVADDLGWTDLGCFGSRFYETPHIDALRRQGMKFTNAYTNGPNCAPTRACLMTGRYSPRHGIYTVASGTRGLERFRKLIAVENRNQLPLDEITLADALRAAGYRTGMFGKWHLGADPPYHPSQRGFDDAVETRRGHFAPDFRTVPDVPVEPGTYLADFLTDSAVGFIEENRDRPFFLYLPHFGVHTPIEAKEPLIARFRNKPAVGGHDDPVYAAMIASVDESVGRITAKLDELDLADETVVIFYSDNGGHGGYGTLGGPTGRNITDNSPLRGGKGMLYEGGVRVPMIVRWPGTIEPDSTCDEPVIGLDFFPTLLELAGRQPDAGHILDGHSLLPLWTGESKTLPGRKALFWHFPGYLQSNEELGTWRTTPAGAIRSGPFKLIEFFEDGRVELYNLADDPSEANDLRARMPDKAAELQERLQAWRSEINAPMPTPIGRQPNSPGR